MIEPDETIINISVYKTPLNENQWTNLYLHHKYICFETEKWYWSIEKNDEGLTIQRSKELKDVRDCYRQSYRCKTKYWSPQIV